ncbi:hypothetical protein ACLGIH_17395 [Streptomyces sp. HMX87]|uniref:hypothetical protein n=1 Tax=Streptomyces sp. HMX87 TaxID=3390849 RepID=UPI003A849996
MSPVPHATARAGVRSAWLRALVLLLALLVPGMPAQVQSSPAAVVSAESGGGPVLEYETVDTALRAPARAPRRRSAPRRPAPVPAAPAPARTVPRLVAEPPPGPPYSLRGLRSVVLRC